MFQFQVKLTAVTNTSHGTFGEEMGTEGQACERKRGEVQGVLEDWDEDDQQGLCSITLVWQI